MKKLNVAFIMLLLCNFVACKKDVLLPGASGTITSALDKENLDAQTIQTIYGLNYYIGGVATTEKKMDMAGLNLARNQLMFSIKSKGSFIDKYIKDGYNVQVNLNWANTASGPVAYPTDTVLIKKRAEAFFQYYQPNKSKIPVVVVENEWDNTNYHKGTIADYLTELRIITDIGHKYGFKIADGGLSSTNLRRWTFTQLDSNEAVTWKTNYFVGDRLDGYSTVIASINEYAAGIKNIPIDYLNVHWYNIDACYNGFEKAARAYLNACGKKYIMTNEFGIKTSSDALFLQTVEELKGIASFAIAYSGTGGEEKAISITDNMLSAF